MVVQAQWPGATVSDTIEQVTDRLERKLQETPNLDYVKSYTTPGQATIFVNLKDSTPPAQVSDIWYQVRKKVGDIRSTLPQGFVGPGFNDEFGDTYGIVYGFTADGFTHRELRDYVEDIRKQLLQLPDIANSQISGRKSAARSDASTPASILSVLTCACAIALTCSGLATITRATNGDSTRTTAMALPVASTTISSSLPRLRPKPSSPARVMPMRPPARSLPSSQNTTSAKVRWMSMPITRRIFCSSPSMWREQWATRQLRIRALGATG
jgi:hypothetical protein